MTDSATAARAIEYIARGWAPIPIPARSKAPILEGWPKLVITAETARHYFNGEYQNIGVLLGEPSGNLVDVDIDCPEAAIAARRLLPDTGCVFGRAGNPSSHWLFLASCRTHKFVDPAGNVLVELRSTGCQTVMPPSVHPSGDLIEWEADNGAVEIEGNPLERLVGRVAAAALVARHWPASARHDTSLALAGALKRSGWSMDQTTLFMRAVLEAAHDDEPPDRLRAVADTFAEDGATTGWPRLKELLGVEVVERLGEWLGVRPAEDGTAHDAEWPEPLPIPEGLPSVPDLDPVLLPETLRGWCEDIAERIQCPIDYPAIGAMVALAAVVGRQVGIRPRRRDDWTVICNLWGAIVGRPGLLKTPALTEVMRPMHRLEVRAREEYEAAILAHEADRIVGKADAKETEKAIAVAIRKKDRALANALATRAVTDEPERPVRRRYVTSDPTIEKLGELLAANPRGVLVYRDELTGWLRELDREGREGSRAFYLEAWNGTGRYTYDRIGRGTIDIEAACVSILGGIQPGPLSEYMRGAIDGGAGDDGLLQRIQFVAWPDPPREWLDVDRWPDTDARRRAWDVFERLDFIEPAAIGAQREDGGIPWLRLDDDATELFRDWRAELEGRLRAGTEHPAFEAALAKHRSLVPSIALLVHLADHHEAGPVGERAMLAAIAWAGYLEAHARRLYSPALDPALHAARELARHIRAGDLPTPFQSRDVYRNGWRLLDRRGTEDALRYLSDLVWLRAEDVNTGGRPRTDWHLNPAVRG